MSKGNRFGRNREDATPPAELISGDNVEGANANVWVVPLAGFANPMYVDDSVASAIGFPIDDCAAVIVYPETGATATITAEQTLDPTGLAGWYNVQGRSVGSQNQPSSVVAVGSATLFASLGLRMRLRVSALTVADLKVRVAKSYQALDVSPASLTTASPVAEGGAPASSTAVPIALQGQTSQKTAQASGTKVNAQGTADGKQIVMQNAVPELRWAYTIASGGITTAAAVTIKAAAGATIKNFLSSFQLTNGGATATEVELRQGAAGTVIWRDYLAAGAKTNVNMADLPPSAVNQLIELAVLTAGARISGGFQGFTGV